MVQISAQVILCGGLPIFFCNSTFSLCRRGGRGLSLAGCLFTSSSIVDFAWGCGECMSLKEGLAAGVGIASIPPSPGDFLKSPKTYYSPNPEDKRRRDGRSRSDPLGYHVSTLFNMSFSLRPQGGNQGAQTEDSVGG